MKKLLPIFALTLFLGCAEKTPKAPAEPAPVTATKTDTIPFPIYLSFEEFEPYLHRSNDTTYVVNFWATWCAPCVKELPYFEKLIAETKGQPIKVLLVSMDFPKAIKKKLIPFVRERGLSESVIALADLDYNSWIDKVSTEWDGAIPITLVYNAKKRKIKIGELEAYEDLEKLVEEIK